MEINKQLFEDVLSGKLKGTFVFRNQLTCDSDELIRNITRNKSMYPYCIRSCSYTSNGIYRVYTENNIDIIDFIPDKNMKENELTIEIPDNKIVDWEKSKKQNKIVLKNKQLTYEDVCKNLFGKSCFYIDRNGDIENIFLTDSSWAMDKNNAPTTHQLVCLLAKNQLANTAKYLNDDWKPSSDSDIFVLTRIRTNISVFKVANGSVVSDCGSIWFKSAELAQQAIEILGEETVKLALEPLGV